MISFRFKGRAPGFSTGKVVALTIFLFLFGCKDPFLADVKLLTSNFLVVEGYINVGANAVTTIRVSRTVPINSTQEYAEVEEDAVIQIQDDQDEFYDLSEGEEGVYSSEPLSLSLDRQYRIRIETSDGKRFYSDYTTPIQSPAIDSVYWTRDAEGVTIKVDTHDPIQSTLFYQWNYEEDWENKSPYLSFYRYSNGDFFPREDAEIIAMHLCWRHAKPLKLITQSVAGLSVENVSQILAKIKAGSDRLSEKYSILVQQHALSLDHYNYFQVMNKNTNQVGTFYDPQPSQLLGNISRENSSEPVVGYIGAYTTSSERLNIRKSDVSPWGFDLDCEQVAVLMSNPDSVAKYFVEQGFLPLTVDEGRINMFAAKPICGDCHERGGNNDKPDFWDAIFEND
ncbi:MAG: DUF4249 domain-containing protein [Cyclobacteriaceae bacterium]|nr:DUF4249 domain-containing protein [Cyclobacteriaceae bacterium]